MTTGTADRPPPAAQPALTFRQAQSPADLLAIARLRYEVYVTEMGRQQPFADHAAQTIHEPLDQRGIVLGAFLADGTAVGTVRLNGSDDPTVTCGDFCCWQARQRSAPNPAETANVTEPALAAQ